MPRTLTADTITAFSSKVIRTEYLFQTAFSSVTLRYWTGMGDLTWDSKTFTGDGKFYGCGSIRESLDVVANGISVDVSGVSTELIALVLSEAKQTNIGYLWRAFLDDDDAIIDVDLRFVGNLDDTYIAEQPNTSTITLNYESRLIRFKKSRAITMSNEAQQSEYKGDKGFEYIQQLQGKRIYWGRADPGRVRI